MAEPERMTEVLREVYIGFGANLGDRLDTYVRAKVLLESKLGPISKESSLYESAALTLDGAESQSDYLNSVLVFDSSAPAQEILAILFEVEAVFRRKREAGVRWAPRPIDLDLLFIGDEVINETNLIVPHRELQKRDFVLCPLCEIAPDLVHPVLGITVKALEASLKERGFERFVLRVVRSDV
jgi:2-amino-4-hydroxy-6-hydroxymethyldihydropteridine diphosphokinase